MTDGTFPNFLSLSMRLTVNLLRTISLDFGFFDLRKPAKLVLGLPFVYVVQQSSQQLGARSWFRTVVLVNENVRCTLSGNRLNGDQSDSRSTS